MRSRVNVAIPGQVNGNNGVITNSAVGVVGYREGAGVYRVNFPPNFILRAITTTIDGVSNAATGADSFQRYGARLLSANTATGAFADYGHRFTAIGDWVD